MGLLGVLMHLSVTLLFSVAAAFCAGVFAVSNRLRSVGAFSCMVLACACCFAFVLGAEFRSSELAVTGLHAPVFFLVGGWACFLNSHGARKSKPCILALMSLTFYGLAAQAMSWVAIGAMVCPSRY